MNAHGKNAKVKKVANPTVDLITTIKAIKLEIADVEVIGATLQQRIHRIACSVLAKVGKDGRIQLLEQFIDAMPDMVRKNSLQTWFETFGPLSFSALENTDSKKKGWRIDRSKKMRLGEAMEKPFWRFKALEGAPYQPLDTDAFINTAIKKLEKDIAECKKAGREHVKSSALLMALKTHNPAAAAN